MPQLPRYESKEQLTTQQPRVQAVASTEGQILENQAKVASDVSQTIAQVSTTYLKANKAAKENVALVNSEEAILKTKNDASLDQDPANEKNYYSQLDQSFNETSKGLDPLATSKLKYEYDKAKLEIGGTFKKLNLDLGTVAVKRHVANLAQNPTPTSFSDIQAYLKQNVADRQISVADAYAQEAWANKELGINSISRDLYQAKTPEDVDAVTQAITTGAYEQDGVTIDPEKKKSLLDISETVKKNVEKKIEAQAAEAKTQNRVDMITGISSGQIDINALDITSISEYDPQLGAGLTKVKDFMKDYNPKIPLEEQRVSMAGVVSPNQIQQTMAYSKSVNDVFMQTNNERLGEFVLTQLEQKGDGNTQSVKLAAFMKLAALKAKANNPQSAKDLESASTLAHIKAGVKFLQSSNPYLAPQAIGDFVVANFLSGAKGEKEVMQEAKSVLKSRVMDRYRSIAKLPSLPNKVVDGEASVEDIQSGLNDYSEGFSGDYADDQPSD